MDGERAEIALATPCSYVLSIASSETGVSTVSIVIFGASGRIGSEIRDEALRRGKKVTAVVHKHQMPVKENLVSVKGEISN